MKNKWQFIFSIVTLLSFQDSGFAQAPNLGTVSGFALFTSAGAFTNTGTSNITGDIGTNAGALTGFPPGILTGQSYVANAVTSQASIDLDTAYNRLTRLTCDSVIGIVLGNGQILTPKVYCISAAATLNGNLILDGHGDPGAIFIFKVNGALSTGTFTNIILINSASVKNIYWQINGSFSLADSSVFTGTLIINGGITLQTGSVLNGRALSLVGAINSTASTVTYFEGGLWKGNISTDFSTAANWSYNAVPASGEKFGFIVSPGNDCILDSDRTVSTVINSSDKNIILNGNQLTISGSISQTGSGKIDASISGSGILMNGSLAQTIPSGTFTSNNISNLIINNTSGVTLGGTLNITGTLSLTNGTLTTVGYLKLISNASGTARVASIQATSDIYGSVIVQRFVPAVARQYRIFSPSTSSFTYSDLIDNIFVTGGGNDSVSSAGGFDASPPLYSPSVYTYHEDTGGTGRGWKAISNITNSLSQGQGTLVFVRGDRTLSGWYTSPFPAQNAVTVDFIGSINKGTISPAITFTGTGDTTSDGWNLVGNPYPSQINWSLVIKTNLDGNYWILDPSTGSYYGNNTGIIASGQAFFVHAISASPVITFNESNKSASPPVNFFKAANPKLIAKMIKDSLNSDLLNIEFVNGAQQNYLATEDILKMYNSKINFGTTTSNGMDVQNNILPPLTGISDTVKLFVSASTGSYSINFSGQSSINSGYSILLKDSFTNTIQDIRTNPVYSFNITSNPASTGYTRFKLVFMNPSLLPVKILTLSVAKSSNKENAILNWITSTEQNAHRFIIERSETDANNFNERGTILAIGNSNITQQYNFTDAIQKSVSQTIYYRLKIIDIDGKCSYSEIVMLNSGNNIEDKFILFPNPVSELISISSASDSRSILRLSIYNIVGKQLSSKEISANSNGEFSYSVSDLNNGIYFLEISNTITGKSFKIRFVKAK